MRTTSSQTRKNAPGVPSVSCSREGGRSCADGCPVPEPASFRPRPTRRCRSPIGNAGPQGVRMSRSNPRPTRRLARLGVPGFTITELLIVIGIIVLLIGILLPALGKVNERAKVAETNATMEEFAKACEAFRQEFGFYPGIVPEEILASDPQISGTENAIFHLMGGAIDQNDPEYNQAPGRRSPSAADRTPSRSATTLRRSARGRGSPASPTRRSSVRRRRNSLRRPARSSPTAPPTTRPFRICSTPGGNRSSTCGPRGASATSWASTPAASATSS